MLQASLFISICAIGVYPALMKPSERPPAPANRSMNVYVLFFFIKLSVCCHKVNIFNRLFALSEKEVIKLAKNQEYVLIFCLYSFIFLHETPFPLFWLKKIIFCLLGIHYSLKSSGMLNLCDVGDTYREYFMASETTTDDCGFSSFSSGSKVRARREMPTSGPRWGFRREKAALSRAFSSRKRLSYSLRPAFEDATDGKEKNHASAVC